jgi:2-keto-4-pentenoate hydratase/2-oxohepta-3-ene-1,7-dioic acid hydratase in catechol pathway
MKFICIGRNYADHAKELKNDLPTEPLFFLKPDSALHQNGHDLYIPEWTNDLHYEVELLVKISKQGKYIEERFAHRYYDQIGLGIDFTARDIQDVVKQKGLPWEKAKAFDSSAVVSKSFVDLAGRNIADLRFSLEKNGEQVQQGHTADMIFSVDHIISYVSQFFTLKTGDIIFTGTPAGVGPVRSGDVLKGILENETMFEVAIR